MGKQTMGTPAQALKHRGDNKLYKLQVSLGIIIKEFKTVDSNSVSNQQLVQRLGSSPWSKLCCGKFQSSPLPVSRMACDKYGIRIGS